VALEGFSGRAASRMQCAWAHRRSGGLRRSTNFAGGDLGFAVGQLPPHLGHDSMAIAQPDRYRPDGAVLAGAVDAL
jgi:hypothetical protein